MMEATKPTARSHRRDRRRLVFHWSSIRCVLIQRIVNSVLVVIGRQMLAAAGSHQAQPWRRRRDLPNGAHQREGRSFTCPSAAVPTAATTSHAFPVAESKYARNTPLNALRRSISFALPSRDLASPSAVCNEISLLKTKHFTPRLLTTGSHVRIRTGEPLCFSNSKYSRRAL
jgi:hypothetical protein